MKERINRQNDENLYQPKIHSDRIHSLFRIKEITGLPLTVLVDLAIGEFLEIYEKKAAEGKGDYGKTDRKS